MYVEPLDGTGLAGAREDSMTRRPFRWPHRHSRHGFQTRGMTFELKLKVNKLSSGASASI
jgi:hypothetical protein